jgi:hypothetical protein
MTHPITRIFFGTDSLPQRGYGLTESLVPTTNVRTSFLLGLYVICFLLRRSEKGGFATGKGL